MFRHYVMFRLKPEARGDLPEIVRRLKGLEGSVPSLRWCEVLVDEVRGPHSFDLLFHARFDSKNAFLHEYMPHPAHKPVQEFIEARVCAIADCDIEN